MKALLLVVLSVSVLANVALLVAPRATDSAAPSPATSTGKVEAEAENRASRAAVAPDTWALIKSGDASAVDRLRAAGFPESVIRAVILAEVNAQFRPRERATWGDVPKREYWQGYESYQAYYTPEKRLASIDLRREKAALLKKLLGEDYIQQDRFLARRYYPLNATKAEAVRAIDEDYQALMANVRGDGSAILPEDREKLRYLEKEKRAELAQMLTPNELFEYDLRQSQTANSMRSRLAAFEPSENEFREIFKLQKTIDDKLGPNTFGMDREYFESRRQLQNDVDSQIQKLLGEQRFAEYKRANDADYRRLFEIGTRLNLRKENIAQAHALGTTYTQKAAQVRRDPEVAKDPAKRNEALAAIAAEAEAEYTKLLGAEGLEAFKQSGFLFRRLQPPAAGPTP